MPGTSHAPARPLLGAALAAALLLAACGGGGNGAEASPDTRAPGTTAGTTEGSGGGKGDCSREPGEQKARVRFVNAYTNPTYRSNDIEVWQGYGVDDACRRKLATVPFGTASDYVEVTATDGDGNWNMVAYVDRASDDIRIVEQGETWTGGEQITFVIEGGDPGSGGRPSAGGVQAVYEKSPKAGDVAVEAVPGRAVIGIGSYALEHVLDDNAWSAGADLQGACLESDGDTGSRREVIGGTDLVSFTVDPGGLVLGLFPSRAGNCAGTPAIGPATIDARAGSRTLVLAYGTGAQDLKLLVLPVQD